MPRDDRIAPSLRASLDALDGGADPMRLSGPTDDLLRYGWASALLEMRADLMAVWAQSEDRARRRAVMRSPELDPATAEAVIAVRRSGMHTLGANPEAPIDLLAANPGARRRRAAVDAALPDGLGRLDEADPEEMVALGSPTVDLALARRAQLDEATAIALASRAHPVPDPWVLAIVADRHGAAVEHAVAGLAAGRRHAVAALRPTGYRPMDSAERPS